jgi:uncharacterized membrane protein YdjX (TVP38/TMEM64 family)
VTENEQERVNDETDINAPPVQRTEAPKTRTIMAIVRLFVLIVLIAGVIAAFRFTPVGELLDEETLGGIIDGLGGAAYPLFILLYAVMLALWVPGTPMTALGAAAFGPAVAIPLNYVGAVLGAVLGFVVARLVGGRSLEELVAPRVPLYRRYERLLQTRGFEAVFYLRLVPTPYTLVSYLAGLSRLPLSRYTLATSLGILPGSIALTYLMGVVVDAGRSGDFSTVWAPKTVAAVGAYLVVASIPAIVSILKSRYGWFRGLDARN